MVYSFSCYHNRNVHHQAVFSLNKFLVYGGIREIILFAYAPIFASPQDWCMLEVTGWLRGWDPLKKSHRWQASTSFYPARIRLGVEELDPLEAMQLEEPSENEESEAAEIDAEVQTEISMASNPIFQATPLPIAAPRPV